MEDIASLRRSASPDTVDDRQAQSGYAGRRIEALPTIAQSQGAAHENAGRMLPARDEAFPDIENEYPPGEQEEGSPDGYWPDQPRLRLR